MEQLIPQRTEDIIREAQEKTASIGEHETAVRELSWQRAQLVRALQARGFNQRDIASFLDISQPRVVSILRLKT